MGDRSTALGCCSPVTPDTDDASTGPTDAGDMEALGGAWELGWEACANYLQDAECDPKYWDLFHDNPYLSPNQDVCPDIHSTNPCTICEMPTDDLIERIAQELERKARVARFSKVSVPNDFERADVTRGNFDQQAWAFDQAARVVREFR